MISTDQIREAFAREDAKPVRRYFPMAQDDPARKCHSAECWFCHGTGFSQRPDIPGVCDVNDKIPF